MFADVEEAVLTRLGARDLLVDLPLPLASPFEGEITRVAIPGHMLGKVGERDLPVRIDAHSFQLGTLSYGYDQWGLNRLG